MKHWDAIIIGAGIIGLSLAIELNRRGLRILIIDKGEAGREASWAAGGMLADFPLELPPALHELAAVSAGMYPEFVRELEDASQMKIDLRSQGTILFTSPNHRSSNQASAASASDALSLSTPLSELEPVLATEKLSPMNAHFLRERSVDPRDLVSAAIAAAKHRGIDFSSGDQVLSIEVASGKTSGVCTNKTTFAAPVVVNCAGAWSGQIRAHDDTSSAMPAIPTRPVKGQMLCVVTPQREFIRHVIRTPDVYLIPRSDGRLLIGATQEEAGFDKQTVPATIQKLHHSALEIAPSLADARILEAWAGLRPGTPDSLPILGPTELPGYFVATGHLRDGILLAPVTAQLMAQMIVGESPRLDLSPFAPRRFRAKVLPYGQFGLPVGQKHDKAMHFCRNTCLICSQHFNNYD